MRPREEQSTLKLIVKLFEDNPNKRFNAYEVAEAVKVTVRNIRPYLKILHGRKIIYIADWRRNRGPFVPMWALNEFGDNEDAPYLDRIPPGHARNMRVMIKRKSNNAVI